MTTTIERLRQAVEARFATAPPALTLAERLRSAAEVKRWQLVPASAPKPNRSTEPASCNLCGETWPRNPVLEVECPTCHNRAGAWCVRPSGHRAMDLHVGRERLALERGLLRPCPKAPLSAAADSGAASVEVVRAARYLLHNPCGAGEDGKTGEITEARVDGVRVFWRTAKHPEGRDCMEFAELVAPEKGWDRIVKAVERHLKGRKESRRVRVVMRPVQWFTEEWAERAFATAAKRAARGEPLDTADPDSPCCRGTGVQDTGSLGVFCACPLGREHRAAREGLDGGLQ